MDPINHINRIIHALRARTSDTLKDERSKKTSENTTAHNRQTTNKRLTNDEIQRLIIEKLKPLSPDERTNQKGIQIFIESILTWTFGDELLRDPKFSEISYTVKKTMLDDPATKEALKAIIKAI